jgi:hypothetical protein
MLKKIFLVFLFSGFILKVEAQFDTAFARINIRRCADSLTIGFKTRNWQLFTRYTYPALIGTLGGKEAFTDYISNAFQQIPISAWKKYEVGKILQIVKKGKDLQTVIELKSLIEWEGRRITTTSYLIGESWNAGNFWTFFDSQSDVKAARQINPELSEAIIIPKKNEVDEMITTPKVIRRPQPQEPIKIKPKAKN